jgi:formamidopyrimidine-DNA glycosylase
MPELPEVETIRLQLLHKVVGKRIKRIEVIHQKSVAHNPTFTATLTGKTIEHIDRVGKLMIWSFKREPDLFLLTHLKMTGQFFYRDKCGISGGGHSMSATDTRDLPGKHTRVAFYFTDGSSLFFNDMRLFGYTKLATAAEMAAARSAFGPEPIHEAFDVSGFTQKLRRRKTSVKAALLDQSFIAGLGNIYVDEALFRAAVRPTRRSDRVSKSEAAAIAHHSGEIMRHSITVGGTTFQHFVDTGGENGNYTDYLQVFGKQNTPCPTCGTLIQKTRVAGRGTHFCPSCQK